MQGGYRWVGLYDVDHCQGTVSNIVFSGPDAPAYPVFSITKGITGRAVAERRTINAGEVAKDPNYLTALSSTRSEIILPIVISGQVTGTLDIESEHVNAFDGE